MKLPCPHFRFCHACDLRTRSICGDALRPHADQPRSDVMALASATDLPIRFGGERAALTKKVNQNKLLPPKATRRRKPYRASRRKPRFPSAARTVQTSADRLCIRLVVLPVAILHEVQRNEGSFFQTSSTRYAKRNVRWSLISAGTSPDLFVSFRQNDGLAVGPMRGHHFLFDAPTEGLARSVISPVMATSWRPGRSPITEAIRWRWLLRRRPSFGMHRPGSGCERRSR